MPKVDFVNRITVAVTHCLQPTTLTHTHTRLPRICLLDLHRTRRSRRSWPTLKHTRTQTRYGSVVRLAFALGTPTKCHKHSQSLSHTLTRLPCIVERHWKIRSENGSPYRIFVYLYEPRRGRATVRTRVNQFDTAFDGRIWPCKHTYDCSHSIAIRNEKSKNRKCEKMFLARARFFFFFFSLSTSPVFLEQSSVRCDGNAATRRKNISSEIIL